MSGAFEMRIAGDLPPGLIAEEARLLEAALARAGLAARAAPAATGPGEKGVLAALGMLTLDALGPIGGKLLDGLKQYFVREQSVVVELTRPDGQKIRLEAKNIGSAKVKAFLDLATDALD